MQNGKLFGLAWVFILFFLHLNAAKQGSKLLGAQRARCSLFRAVVGVGAIFSVVEARPRRRKHSPDEEELQRRKEKHLKKKRAKGFTKQAIAAAEGGNLRGALPLFAKALRTIPFSPRYMSNLAVTHLRLQQYHAAEELLRKALSADPTQRDALNNFASLRTFLPHDLNATDGPHTTQRVQRHKTRRLKRIPVEELALASNSAYRKGQKPFVLTGVFSLRERAFSEWSFSYFLHKYPGAMMEHYSRNMVHESVKPVFTPIREAYKDFQAHSSLYKDKPGVYSMWNLDEESWNSVLRDFSIHHRGISTNSPAKDVLPGMFTSDDSWIHSCFPTRSVVDDFLIGTHWRMILIGNEGAGMFNHRDILRSASFQIQVVGGKRWHICSPSQDRSMYHAGDIDTFNPDYERFPLALQADCIDDFISPGEILYYPRDYWHHTEVPPSSDGRPSISLTGTLATQGNFREMADELRRECFEGGNRIPLSQYACSHIENCFAHWNATWGVETETYATTLDATSDL